VDPLPKLKMHSQSLLNLVNYQSVCSFLFKHWSFSQLLTHSPFFSWWNLVKQFYFLNYWTRCNVTCNLFLLSPVWAWVSIPFTTAPVPSLRAGNLLIRELLLFLLKLKRLNRKPSPFFDSTQLPDLLCRSLSLTDWIIGGLREEGVSSSPSKTIDAFSPFFHLFYWFFNCKLLNLLCRFHNSIACTRLDWTPFPVGQAASLIRLYNSVSQFRHLSLLVELPSLVRLVNSVSQFHSLRFILSHSFRSSPDSSKSAYNDVGVQWALSLCMGFTSIKFQSQEVLPLSLTIFSSFSDCELTLSSGLALPSSTWTVN